MKYFDELCKAMDFLSEHPDTIFLGQSVEVKGTGMFTTLKNVPLEKRLELPVAEDMQMGMTNGLALCGKIPISIFPRWNFLLLATNQIVNHLDKIPLMSDFKTKVIIRTGVGSERPLNPFHQHIGDFSEAFSLMCKNVEIIKLNEPKDIFPAYQKSLNREDGKSTLLVEISDFYNEK